jgi:hypothetical protein
MIRVKVQKNSKEIIEKECNSYICRIGRSPFADITLNDNFVSFNHIVIVEIYGYIFLFDRGLNRVLLNGIPLEKGIPYYVRIGDEIKLGEYVISIEFLNNINDSRTLFLYENVNRGIGLNDIFEICNQGQDYIKVYSDSELNLLKIMEDACVKEVGNNPFSRAILVKKERVRFFIILNTSRYYSYTSSKSYIKSKRKRFNVLDWVIISLLLLTIAFSIILTIYFSI